MQIEVDPMLIQNDLEGLHARIRDAFITAQQAVVSDEPTRLQAQVQAAPSLVTQALPSNGNGHRNGSEVHHNGSTTKSNGTSARSNGTGGRPPKAANTNQVRAVVTIARRQHADLEGLLHDEDGVEQPEDLSLTGASKLIDQLKIASLIRRAAARWRPQAAPKPLREEVASDSDCQHIDPWRILWAMLAPS